MMTCCSIGHLLLAARYCDQARILRQRFASLTLEDHWMASPSPLCQYDLSLSGRIVWGSLGLLLLPSPVGAS